MTVSGKFGDCNHCVVTTSEKLNDFVLLAMLGRLAAARRCDARVAR
jgi:hypothetical protein